MKTSFFLVVSRKGADRITQNSPKLTPGEIAVKVSLQMPDALFHTPVIQAAIVVPDSVAQAEPISAEVQENVRELIQASTGMEVRLIVEMPTPETK